MSVVDEIKKKIDIVNFIGQYVHLKKAGRNFQGLCPFHSEKTPSFMVSPDRQRWHCFGACHEGGDVVSFLMKYERYTFGEALEKLAPLAGVTLEHDDFVDRDWDLKKRITAINQMAADYYHYILTKHAVGEKARAYLNERGLTNQLIEAFHVGYAPHSWDSLTTFLKKRKCSIQDCIASGLVVQKNPGKMYDRFRARVMFPLTNPHGTILGFSGRIVIPDDRAAKYMNTPETTLYHKRETLFGIQQAKEAMIQKKEAIIMEGEFDVISAHRFGYTQSVGIKGTALTNEQLELLKRYASTFIFCLDTDEAGIDAAKRGITLAEAYDVSLYVMQLQGGKDPADLFASDPSQFKKAYRERLSIYEFLLQATVKTHDPETLYGKKAIVDEMSEVIQNIQNPVVKEYVTRELAKLVKSEPAVIAETIRRRRRKKVRTVSVEKRFDAHEDYLLALLAQSSKQKECIEVVRHILKDSDYAQPSTPTIIEAIIQNKAGEHMPPQLKERFAIACMMRIPDDESRIANEVKQTALTIKANSLKLAIKKAGDEKLPQLVTELGSVEKALHTVYNTEHGAGT